MGKAKLTLTGEVSKIKVNEDGTTNLIMKAGGSNNAPKGLKAFDGETAYSINVSAKHWRKVADQIVEETTRVIVNGEQKASVSSKGTPFVSVICFEINVLPSKETNEKSKEELPKVEAPKPKIVTPPIKEEKQAASQQPQLETTLKETKNKIYHAVVEWQKTNKENIVQIPSKDIYLADTAHLNHAQFALGNVEKMAKNINPITVQKTDKGYALVMGLKWYVIGKMLNMETVPAIITELSFSQLSQELGIEQLSTKKMRASAANL